jgi:Ca2+-binding RTX toxin-like protein
VFGQRPKCHWASLATTVAVVLGTYAFAGESFPIRGTGSGDTIELLSIEPAGNGARVAKVKINGDTQEYDVPVSRWEWEIKAGAGDDRITISDEWGGDGFIVYGEAGEDVIQGGEGDDIIIGGTGGDEIRGGNGNDWLKGCEHKDRIEGGPGNDIIYGNGAEDTLRGGAGNDLIDGGEGEDTIWGDDGNDKLFGEAGNDHIRGGPGDDVIRGGNGNDSLRGDDGHDVLLGEDGSDTNEDSPSVSESTYEDNREEAMEEIEDDFGVEVVDWGRKWSRSELHYLRSALSLLPDKVLDMWHGTGGKITYRRKEVTDTESMQHTATGNTTVAIYLFDLNWLRDSGELEYEWVQTIVHETGHAYNNSPALSSSDWSDFKALSGWSGSNHDEDAEFVSGYADDSADEDWAESFAYYFTDPDELKDRAEGKYEFLNDMFGLYSGTATTATPAEAVTTPGGPTQPGDAQIAPAPKPKPPIRPRPRPGFPRPRP